MKGFPTKFWKPSEISSYLKGQAKLAALVAEGENARAKWLSENGGDDSGFADYWEKEQGSDEFTEMLGTKYGLVWEKAPEVDGSTFTVPSRRSVRQIRREIYNG